MGSNSPSTETYHNRSAISYTCPPPANASDVLAFHKTLPTYARTPLVALPASLSAALGVGTIQVKDESRRFGLPSFKILGASWAVHRTLCARLALDPTKTPLASLAPAARRAGLRLVSCTDGNWGRALASVAHLAGVPAVVYVPRAIDAATRERIASEGAEVRVVQGDYDASVRAAGDAARESGALLVLDTSWPGYEEIPRWVTEGYESMLAEVDEALASDGETGTRPDLVIVSVGVGSWAHSVVSHYKSQQPHPASGRRTMIVTVEPTAAPSLLSSLHNKAITPISTEDTIMCGMCCGTTSTIAWPLLRDGVDLALTVSDLEAHEAVLELNQCGVEAGPCGAAPFAALRKISREDLLGGGEQWLSKDAKVVLFCTEGARAYDIPDAEAKGEHTIDAPSEASDIRRTV